MKIPSLNSVGKSIATFINKSPTSQKILETVSSNNALYSGLLSFGLAGCLRPLAIGTLPFKNTEDKQVSQISALSAGLVELGFTCALFIPLNKSISRASEELYKNGDKFWKSNNLKLRNFKSVSNRGCKLLALIPMSLLRFGLIKPLQDKFNKRGCTSSMPQHLDTKA